MKAKPEQKTTIPQRKEPLRLLALSDGVFATVLTLLVLDLRIPDTLNADGGNMLIFLKWFGPHFFSYLLTFLVTGTYWLAHHRNFDHVVSSERSLLGYNLLFLLFIGLLPFSTATISLTNFKSGAFPFYWAIYAANIILAGIMINLTWLYAVSHHLVDRELTRAQSLYISARQIATPAVFLLSIVMEYLFPQAFLGPYTLWVIPLVMWGVDRRFSIAYPNTPARPQGWVELLWRAGTVLPWLLIIGLAVWMMTF